MKSMPKNKINTILILFQDILSHNQIRSIQPRTALIRRNRKFILIQYQVGSALCHRIMGR